MDLDTSRAQYLYLYDLSPGQCANQAGRHSGGAGRDACTDSEVEESSDKRSTTARYRKSNVATAKEMTNE